MKRNIYSDLSIFALASSTAFAGNQKDFTAIDAYIDNVNRIFALADENPGNPNKVLTDATIKTLDRKDTQYLTSILLLDKQKMNLRWGRQEDHMMLVNIKDQKILGTLDIGDFDEKRTIGYDDKKINVMQFFEGGDLRTRTNRLVRAFDDMKKAQHASLHWGFRFIDIAWELISSPFRLDSAFALPPGVPANSPLAKAAAANGPDCQNIRSVTYTVRSMVCVKPREAATAVSVAGEKRKGYTIDGKQIFDDHGRALDSNGNPKWRQQ